MVKLKCHDPSKSNSQDQAFKSELNQGYPPFTKAVTKERAVALGA